MDSRNELLEGIRLFHRYLLNTLVKALPLVVSAGKINPLFSWEEVVLGETVIRQVSDLMVSAVRYEVEGALGVGCWEGLCGQATPEGGGGAG